MYECTCLESTYPIEKIPLIMRVPFTGAYCVGIDTCVECGLREESGFCFEQLVGFATNSNGETEMLWECQRCFTINRYHFREEMWNYLMRFLCKNQSKYYQMVNGVIKRVKGSE